MSEDVNNELPEVPEQQSPMAELILQLKERLDAVIPGKIRHLEEDKYQLEGYEVRPPVDFPCMLVSTSPNAIIDHPDNSQGVELGIMLRIALPPYSVGASWFDKATILASLGIHQLEQDVFRALHGWTPKGFSALLRRPGTTEMRRDTLRVKRLMYETSYEDSTAVGDAHELPGDAFEWQVSAELEKDEEDED